MPLADPALLRDRCLVDGAWIAADDGAVRAVRDPADGAAVGTVPALGAAETGRAIAAAARAFPAWRARPARERSAVLRAWFEHIIAAADDLAAILTAEQGKPLPEARAEIAYAAGFVEWFAEEAKRAYGELVPAPRADQRIAVLRQPVGVAAAITPWNFPAAMVTRKVAPALAAGCPIIVRPADLTPLTALALAELACRAGAPPGVLQVLTGPSRAIGGALTASPAVRKLSFTGSTEVGRVLMAQCAPTIKRLSLELGGNAPFIVFDDADLDAAVDGAMAAKFRNAGQTCVCANRFLVQRGIHDAFAARLAERAAALAVGPGAAPGTAIGPLISDDAAERVLALVADALARGARALAGGGRHALGGRFVAPTVLVGVAPEMPVAAEEVFGPVAPIIPFADEDEAVRLANGTIHGLAGYLYTRDGDRAQRVIEALECGMIGHNTGQISNEVAPFGGVKQSGLGREGSRHGLDEYLEQVYVCRGLAARRDAP